MMRQITKPRLRTSSLLGRISAPVAGAAVSQIAWVSSSAATVSAPFGPNAGVVTEEDRQHVFQPLAAQNKKSPMRRQATWLEALRSKPTPALSSKSAAVGAATKKSEDVEEHAVQDRVSQDSFAYVVLPFKNDPWLLDSYIDSNGEGLRVGQLFQDLDALACVSAYRHCHPAKPAIVTASVDRVLLDPAALPSFLDKSSVRNVSLSGTVTWTGRSSMEITVKVAAHDEELHRNSKLQPDDIKEENVFMVAHFTFVARNTKTNKSFPINRLVPQTKQELADFKRAENYNLYKRSIASKKDLRSKHPSEEESELIHSLWLNYEDQMEAPTLINPLRKKSSISAEVEVPTEKVILMQDTTVESTALMQPQNRNIHSYMIFGGYLLRQTFDLAHACVVKSFPSVQPPLFNSLDSTTFKSPVPVGSILKLTATAVYGSNEKVQVRVDAVAVHAGTGESKHTGTFAYSFSVNTNVILLPKTYKEMMWYLEGRRKVLESEKFYLHGTEESNNQIEN
jgi:acyl-coenzyme A thioesterase 9